MVHRIGVIVPSPNTVLEGDVFTLLPYTASAHFARVGFSSVLSVELLHEMAEEVSHESRKLVLAGVQAIGYGCTSGSFFSHDGFDQQMTAAITSASGGIPATTATTAALYMLRELQAERIVFCSPYDSQMHRRGVDYFARQGFTIASESCLGLMEEKDITAVTYQQIEQLVASCSTDSADAVFISCTGLAVTSYLDVLSQQTGIPVLSSNQALTAHLMKLGGIT